MGTLMGLVGEDLWVGLAKLWGKPGGQAGGPSSAGKKGFGAKKRDVEGEEGLLVGLGG